MRLCTQARRRANFFVLGKWRWALDYENGASTSPEAASMLGSRTWIEHFWRGQVLSRFHNLFLLRVILRFVEYFVAWKDWIWFMHNREQSFNRTVCDATEFCSFRNFGFDEQKTLDFLLHSTIHDALPSIDQMSKSNEEFTKKTCRNAQPCSVFKTAFQNNTLTTQFPSKTASQVHN